MTNYSCPLSINDERMNSIDEELFEAAQENNLPEVRRLVSVGADVSAKDNDGETPLHRASFEGHSQVVNELMEHGADIEAKARFGQTPLHWACYSGHVAVVIELLSRGANIQAKDNDGDTPLHQASLRGYLPIVKALLSSGADILEASDAGQLPIHLAVSNGNSEVARYLLQQLYVTTRPLPLHELLEDITWIGNPDSIDGVPPLCTALRRNVLGSDDVVEIIEYLVGQNPALLSSRDHDGSLPLHIACRRGASFTIVQALVNRYKASVKSVTPQGDLPLFLACEMSDTSLDTIFLLMKLYPDLVLPMKSRESMRG
jgi:ankyrin repeat protein